ncbi:hypothetical protein [Brassicibacter mesophilus]
MSRNPMYVAYFIYFLGCSLLSGSFVLFISLKKRNKQQWII